jgi:alkylation response protein AidB-like acyl-CoA dehydrogenase
MLLATYYVINGEKTSITSRIRADAYLIFARTGKPEEGAKGRQRVLHSAGRLRRGFSRTHFDDVGSAIIGRRSGVLRRRARAAQPSPRRRRARASRR